MCVCVWFSNWKSCNFRGGFFVISALLKCFDYVVVLNSCYSWKSYNRFIFIITQSTCWVHVWGNTLLWEPLSSVQFSRSVVSDSLRLHESQHTRPPCPSPSPRVHSDSRPSSQWCHPVISSSVIPFSSCPQSLPASKSSPMSQLFAWGGQSTGVSALASFFPNKFHGWSPSEWTG